MGRFSSNLEDDGSVKTHLHTSPIVVKIMRPKPLQIPLFNMFCRQSPHFGKSCDIPITKILTKDSWIRFEAVLPSPRHK